ncbi:MAG: PLU-1-like domain protein [Leptospiraceae bacterium]|nr:PLU-1-like domain protein [Leptospiraceae bacterium]
MTTRQPCTLKEVEVRFDDLSNITDLVAQINSIYESDIEGNIQAMEDFIHDAMSWDLSLLDLDALQFYLSHMSFHREIVSEIITEARQVLIEERRSYVKRLVNYHKEFKRWVTNLEKNYAA